jgi:autotransporter-associated beta strand protein
LYFFGGVNKAMNILPARFIVFFCVVLALGIMAHAVPADTIVQFNYNCYLNGIYAPVGSYQVQLTDDLTPITVENFLQYVNYDLYNNTFIHRAEHNRPYYGYDPDYHFVIQGGGFEIVVDENNHIVGADDIYTFDPIENESSSALSNVRGTIAMARTSDPDSATSQWYVNTVDNTFLDDQYGTNSGYTVFGRVVGEGMTLIDAIDNLPIYDLNSYLDPSGTYGSPFSQVPLFGGGSYLVTVLSVDIISTSAWIGGSASGATNWGLAANWDPGSGVPNGAGVNLNLGTQAVENAVLDMISADRTVGNIYFSSDTSITIQSTGAHTLNLNNNGSASLVSVLGSHTITAPVELHNNLLISGFNETGDLAISGAISGTGTLTAYNLGTLTLSGANTFDGPVNIYNATIKAAALDNLGAGTEINFDGGVLQFDGVFDPSVRTMTFLSGGATLDTQDNDITLANIIGNNGAGGLTKLGAGTLTLTSFNTFTGAVNFNEGLIKAAVLNNLGTGSALNFDGGGLQFDGVFDISLRSVTFLAGGATLDTQDNNIILGSGIGNGGAGGLTKNGAGTLQCTGEVSYDGATVINEGVLKINNNLTTALHDISGDGALTVDGASTVLSADTINVSALTVGEGAKIIINAIFSSSSSSGSAGFVTIGSSASLQGLPEPSAVVLLGIGVVALLAYARPMRKRSP